MQGLPHLAHTGSLRRACISGPISSHDPLLQSLLHQLPTPHPATEGSFTIEKSFLEILLSPMVLRAVVLKPGVTLEPSNPKTIPNLQKQDSQGQIGHRKESCILYI
jgi:hypothetical protein